jgi:hypothetical protein
MHLHMHIYIGVDWLLAGLLNDLRIANGCSRSIALPSVFFRFHICAISYYLRVRLSALVSRQSSVAKAGRGSRGAGGAARGAGSCSCSTGAGGGRGGGGGRESGSGGSGCPAGGCPAGCCRLFWVAGGLLYCCCCLYFETGKKEKGG